MAVPQTSPSPCAACPSPMLSRAPSWNTGRKRVAWLRTLDGDGAVDLVHAREIERGDVGDGRRGGQLAAAGIEQVELDHAAAGHGLDRWNRRIPGQVEAVAADVNSGGLEHVR